MTMTAVYVNGGGLVNPHYARWDWQDSVESGCQTDCSKEEEEGQARQLTPFEKLTQDMSQDEKVVREITLGKRIGFYRIRGEIGSGNFSQVKLGIHSLTKGRIQPPKDDPAWYRSLVCGWVKHPGPRKQVKHCHQATARHKPSGSCCPLLLQLTFTVMV